MKVLHCITGLSGDGAQRMLLRLARGLSSSGIRSHIVSLADEGVLGDDFRSNGIGVSALRLVNPLKLLPGVLAFRAVVRSFKPDIIQGWMYHANVFSSAVRAVSSTKAPLIWNIRRGLDDFSERRLVTRAWIRASAAASSQATTIIYCSRRSQEQHEKLGFARHASAVIGNGFDVQRFQPSATKRMAFREALGLPRDAVVVGNVGRFDVAKGHRYLLEAFCRLASRYSQLHLVCVGRGVSWSESGLGDLASARQYMDRIHFVPEQRDVAYVFSAFDLYCSASIAEGFPNVVAEALSSSLPVVATDTGATRELVASSGIVVSPRSALALEEGIEQLLRETSHELLMRGEAGRQKMERYHSLAGVVAQYQELYQVTLQS